MLVIVMPVVLATTAAVLVLMRMLDVASSQGRLEMIRTALAVGAGTGAVMTLVLAWRRQWSTEHDAAERRLTELYVKAIEQLGSDKAAVRHGALYALERVAQDNPDHRQTVIDVICAYLRAPYTPLVDKPGASRLGGLRAPLRPAHARPTNFTAPKAPTTEEQERRQEREVRLTAQHILHRHLQPGSRSRLRRRTLPTFWADIDLDLTGATLIDFTLANTTIRTAGFEGATFTGDAWFDAAAFTGDARFYDATFTDDAGFAAATFTGDAGFSEATFIGNAGFDGAVFAGVAWFGEVVFDADVSFRGATFTGRAWFDRAIFTIVSFRGAAFTDRAWFSEAAFTDAASFDGATFTGDVRFDEAAFTGNVNFSGTTFTGDATFDGATLPSARLDDHTTPSPWTSFISARFERRVPPEVARFVPEPAD
ncbi:pentapeptide repeat-containing protein [Actinokineospora sp. NPDC004072]